MKHHDLVIIGTGSGDSVIDSPMADWAINAPPRRLAVLGGGYVAAELAHVFSAVGSQITVIEEQEMLHGGPQDDEVRRTLTDLMKSRWDLRLGTELNGLTGRLGDLTLTVDDGSTARRPHWIHPALTEVVQNALLDVPAAA